MIDFGDQRRLSIEIKDINGALTDSTVTLNITLPDQTVAGPSVPVHDSLGEYHYDYTTVQAGRHVARWTGTSPVFAHTEVFDVEVAADISIVSLGSIKAQLAKSGSVTVDDDELRGYLLSASENIENMCGPCAVRSFTERLASSTGSRRSLWLSNIPVVSVTSFTPVFAWSAAIAATDVTVNLVSGEVTRLDAWPIIGDYDITYKAGRTVIPSSIRTACQIIVQHLWETRRGASSAPRYGADETVTLPGWGYAIPNAAADLLSGFREPMFLA